MKRFQRTVSGGGYDLVTTVFENGDYEQIARFPDGMITSYCKGNIFTWGWRSLREFMRERKGFHEINE